MSVGVQLVYFGDEFEEQRFPVLRNIPKQDPDLQCFQRLLKVNLHNCFQFASVVVFCIGIPEPLMMEVVCAIMWSRR